MTDLFDRVLLPVANEADAAATARAVEGHLEPDTTVIALNVVEKAGGAPDKASVEQRELEAEDAFQTLREALGDVETEIRYGTDIADTVFAAAADHDATSIAFTPRGGGRLVRLLTGNVAMDLVTGTDRPVVVLPDPDAETDGGPIDGGETG